MSIQETAEDSAVVSSKGARASRQRPRGYVTLFDAWCKGCGICVEFCPQHVLEASGMGRTVVAHVERCTACHWCDTHCPDMAITVSLLDPEEAEETEAQAAPATPVPGGAQ
jgi:2-oxoglutarate ferredoxin oxidoreductase subunit delta